MAAGSGFGAGGKVGTGADAGSFGWSGAAGTIGFVNTRLGLRAGLYVQYMPPELYPTRDEFRRCIELAIEMKARVVSEDFREAGLREVLNYGHTLGHAIEHAERYRWRHGAAISIGMMYAAELSLLAGRLSEEDVVRHRLVGAIVDAYGRWDETQPQGPRR